MELILFVIVLVIIICIIGLPFWLMFKTNLFLGIAILGLYDFIIYKIIDVPAISIVAMFLLRVFLYSALFALGLIGVLFICCTYFNLSLDSIEVFPELFNKLSVIIEVVQYYIC